MIYTPRLTRPSKSDKYYITKAKGGYSSAIQGKCKSTGKPDTQCNVLSNCVGYAYGRFHEITQDTKMSYISPVNAENFPEYTKCKTGKTPKLGAVIVWQKGSSLKNCDGAGHVAIVEKINSDGSILISQSGYNSSPFWTETLKKGDGNWRATWMSKDYKFRCFIYSPIEFTEDELTKSLEVLCNNKTYTVRTINHNEENYIRLRDLDDVLNIVNVSYNSTKHMPEVKLK